MDTIGAVLTVLKYALVLAILLILVDLLSPLTTSMASLMDRLAPQAAIEVVASRRIISSLRGIGTLVSVTSDPHVREVHIGIRQGLLGLESYGANHLAEGIIEAGIDFRRIQVDALRCEDSCILTVPAPKITSCNMVGLRQKDQSHAVFGRDWELLEEIGWHEAVQAFIKDVTELRNILGRAREETALTLGNFVSALVEKPVHVVFEDSADETELPETCKPEPPAGWTKDENGDWKRE